MAARKGAARPAISDERAEEIRAAARSGTNWAAEVAYGSACVCGAFLDGSTATSWGRAVPKGECHRHGVVQYSRIAKRGTE